MDKAERRPQLIWPIDIVIGQLQLKLHHYVDLIQQVNRGLSVCRVEYSPYDKDD